MCIRDSFYSKARHEAQRLGLDENFIDYITPNELGNPTMPNYKQQFSAPPGVLDMDCFHCSIHFYMGNKAVGTVNKNAVCDFSVFQSLLHFQYRIREPCPSLSLIHI